MKAVFAITIFLFVALGVMAWAVAIIFFADTLKYENAIARLEAERDSLLAVKAPMRETETTLYVNRNTTVAFQWDMLGDSFIAVQIKPWPPDTLKHQPLKRKE